MFGSLNVRNKTNCEHFVTHLQNQIYDIPFLTYEPLKIG